jgi:hypothetical protein
MATPVLEELHNTVTASKFTNQEQLYVLAFAQTQQVVRPDPELAGRVAWTWEAQSKATHPHGYGVPPDRRDLGRWMSTVAELASGAGS